MLIRALKGKYFQIFHTPTIFKVRIQTVGKVLTSANMHTGIQLKVGMASVKWIEYLQATVTPGNNQHNITEKTTFHAWVKKKRCINLYFTCWKVKQQIMSIFYAVLASFILILLF